MSEHVVALSVNNMKQLSRDLKALSASLKDSVTVDIERNTCKLIAADLQTNIAGIPDVDGNYLGTDNPNASVTVGVAFGTGHHVSWRGKQITFVEFGTGATGAGGSYPGVAMSLAGYTPDPTKERWVYRDSKTGQGVVSYGIPPYAPMYQAGLTAKRDKVHVKVAKEVLGEAVRGAITV